MSKVKVVHDFLWLIFLIYIRSVRLTQKCLNYNYNIFRHRNRAIKLMKYSSEKNQFHFIFITLKLLHQLPFRLFRTIFNNLWIMYYGNVSMALDIWYCTIFVSKEKTHKWEATGAHRRGEWHSGHQRGRWETVEMPIGTCCRLRSKWTKGQQTSYFRLNWCKMLVCQSQKHALKTSSIYIWNPLSAYCTICSPSIEMLLGLTNHKKQCK